ncbi:MAG: alkaline phosphatase D family protein [Nocardioides sp.]
MTSPHSIHRRTVLATGSAGAALTTVAASSQGADAATEASRRYFQHGVASGDPLPNAVLIWTRVSPTPASRPGSGKGPKVEVEWEVATDRRFRRIVRRGTFATSASRDHTVKLDVTGLKPATWYHYRFTYRGTRSRVGRMRTAPAVGSSPRFLRFGVVSCANWQAGYFAGYRGIAERDDLHAVVHLGDYIYEYPVGGYAFGPTDIPIRKHDPPHEMVSLEDYRRRFAQYKTDPDLQDAHAKYPWIITWDDHEVTNDQWKNGAENHQPGQEGNYRRRRARAHRAFDEWMPVRLDGTARLGDGSRLYRRLTFGTLAELSMLDLRTYRSKQVETVLPFPVPTTEAAVSDPDLTITGATQMRWLKQSLSSDQSLWKVIGNPVMIMPLAINALPDQLVAPVNAALGLLPDDGFPINVDQWDGYTHDRREVFRHIKDNQVQNALFITGDIHSGWAGDLPYDAATYPLSGSAGVEFVCTSVTSNNLKDEEVAPAISPTNAAIQTAILANNRHMRYLNFNDHGFSVLDLTAKRAQMDWFITGDRRDKNAPIHYSTSYATRVGTNTVRQVNGPVDR